MVLRKQADDAMAWITAIGDERYTVRFIGSFDGKLVGKPYMHKIDGKLREFPELELERKYFREHWKVGKRIRYNRNGLNSYLEKRFGDGDEVVELTEAEEISSGFEGEKEGGQVDDVAGDILTPEELARFRDNVVGETPDDEKDMP